MQKWRLKFLIFHHVFIYIVTKFLYHPSYLRASGQFTNRKLYSLGGSQSYFPLTTVVHVELGHNFTVSTVSKRSNITKMALLCSFIRKLHRHIYEMNLPCFLLQLQRWQRQTAKNNSKKLLIISWEHIFALCELFLKLFTNWVVPVFILG